MFVRFPFMWIGYILYSVIYLIQISNYLQRIPNELFLYLLLYTFFILIFLTSTNKLKLFLLLFLLYKTLNLHSVISSVDNVFIFQ